MRVFELFAGAGGAALGLHRAGFEHAGLVEWDRHACATLREAGFGPVLEGDARDLDAVTAGIGAARVDLLWSSFPCQAFSVAGKRLGAADPRNGWPWTTAALDRIKPTWFLGENVGGLRFHRKDCPSRKGGAAEPESCAGCYFSSTILGDLRRRFAHVGWWFLDAADYGVPQHRRRIILWAGPVSLAEPEPTHGPGRALPWVSMGQALGLDGAVYTGRWGDGRGPICAEGPAPTVTTEWGHAAPWTKAGVGWLTQPSPTVATTEEKGTRASASSGWTFSGGPDRASDAFFLATGRRRLTWQECAVLQDFPADYPFQGPVGARYRQIGNAVPPKLAEVVGRAVLNAHEGGQDDDRG